ncbi:MAG: hypothetical protein JRF59_12060 [Deltaproteobacteria bacterium]|nr:hypothetical protein [Deltaproteobacteria bacterium]MBW1924316.1 hypothetical protein [Deltaproteobacteria bacterium]MBW1950144.1 hypothetical protein [Deltaproteobacteria bacterium]MBW2009001.1 hypothetical protein [Deltaproteobacteria bacterium]MBW2348559.1 hypothetical protein [Deltaproteobacteria bacterium]
MVFDNGGITYVISEDLYNRVKPIKIDFVNSPMGSGFSISSNLPVGAACGSSCSC